MTQLQSILFPSKEICDVPELYYHVNGNRIDFDGYFNYFAIEKRKKYTAIQELSLSISLYGYVQLIIVHDGKDIEAIDLEEEKETDYRIRFPYKSCRKGLFWFALISSEKIDRRHVKGYYQTDAEEIMRKVNIGIDICTFKRETYVYRNLQRLAKCILDQKELDVSEHIKIHIVDNGKTLKGYEPIQELLQLYEDKLRLIPNKNAGGAGGFTKGMIEILETQKQEAFTHVLLMDDDAIVEPDALVRLYGFLSTLKEEWKDVTVGGAMLREDYPYMLFCAGEWWERGSVTNPEPHLDLRDFAAASCDYLVAAQHEHDRYSGWWCCCYSLNVVREDNLPIPLFIHHDDIEFGLRNAKYGTVFLNGVGVWHRGGELAFPGANTYYDIRNNLIEIALQEKKEPKKIARNIVFKSITVAAIRLRYKDAELVYQGLIDFLKGPAWLYKQNPEVLNERVRSMAPRMYGMEELRKKISEEDFRAIEKQIENYRADLNVNTILACRRKRIKATILHLTTYNGWLLPSNKKEIKVIFSMDSPFEAFRKQMVVLCETGSWKVLLARRSYKELFKLMGMYVKAYVLLNKRFDAVAQNYKDNIGRIINKKAWKEYLNIK